MMMRRIAGKVSTVVDAATRTLCPTCHAPVGANGQCATCQPAARTPATQPQKETSDDRHES